MEQFVAKGYTFPEQDWWDEKKCDVSFLYTVEDDSSSSGGSRPVKQEEAFAQAKDERSEYPGPNGGKIRLDSWIEESRQDLGPAPSKITSVAGYVNPAYPIMKTLVKKKRGHCDEIKDKELKGQIDRVAANLRRILDAVARVQPTVGNARVPPGRADPLKHLIHQKSTAIISNFEKINVLMNMIKNSEEIPKKEPSLSGISKVYGSVVDMV